MMPIFKASFPVGLVCVDSGWKRLLTLLMRIPSPMEGMVRCWILMPMIIVSSIAARTIIIMTLNILRLRFSIFMIRLSVTAPLSQAGNTSAAYGSSPHHRTKTLQPHPSGRESLPPPLGGHGKQIIMGTARIGDIFDSIIIKLTNLLLGNEYRESATVSMDKRLDLKPILGCQSSFVSTNKFFRLHDLSHPLHHMGIRYF